MSTNSSTTHFDDRAERRLGLDLPRVEYPKEPIEQCHSTEAIIKHSEDDDGEEVSSKMAPSPKKTLWRVVKEFFQKRRGPSSFANFPPHAFF
jgi:hypothetical protein